MHGVGCMVRMLSCLVGSCRLFPVSQRRARYGGCYHMQLMEILIVVAEHYFCITFSYVNNVTLPFT